MRIGLPFSRYHVITARDIMPSPKIAGMVPLRSTGTDPSKQHANSNSRLPPPTRTPIRPHAARSAAPKCTQLQLNKCRLEESQEHNPKAPSPRKTRPIPSPISPPASRDPLAEGRTTRPTIRIWPASNRERARRAKPNAVPWHVPAGGNGHAPIPDKQMDPHLDLNGELLPSLPSP